MANLILTQVKSVNGSSKKQRATLQTLGLGRINRTSERPDSDTLRAQVHSVRHLVEVSESG